MKHQVIIIHGGDTFDNYDEYLQFLKEFEVDLGMFNSESWKKTLETHLGENFEVLAMQMPNKFNAKYLEWKIWFEKFIPFFKDGLLLVGHSLGGIFLAKYLAENILPKKILGLFLIAAPYANVDTYSLADFILPESLEKITEQVSEIFLYQSQDDEVVPFSEVEAYQRQLSKSTLRIFENRGHFNQENFPELVNDIKNLP